MTPIDTEAPGVGLYLIIYPHGRRDGQDGGTEPD